MEPLGLGPRESSLHRSWAKNHHSGRRNGLLERIDHPFGDVALRRTALPPGTEPLASAGNSQSIAAAPTHPHPHCPPLVGSGILLSR